MIRINSAGYDRAKLRGPDEYDEDAETERRNQGYDEAYDTARDEAMHDEDERRNDERTEAMPDDV